MAHYKVSFRVNCITYFTGGDCSYPSDEAIEKDEIDMDIAYESAAIFAADCKKTLALNERIEPGSIEFEIYR